MTLLDVHLKFYLTLWIIFSLAAQQTTAVCTCASVRKWPACARVVLAWGLWLTSLKLRLTVPGVLLQALFLIDDDVLDVLHGEVVAEGVEQDVFQLLQGDPLHVELPQYREDTFRLADLYHFF